MAATVLRYRYRAYPTKGQDRALSRLFGCCRVVFNDAIRAREKAHAAGQPYPKVGELSVQLLTKAKQSPERAFLTEVSAVALQQALADADRAYRSFFSSLKGKRAGRKVGHPRFRSRRDRRQSARFTRNAHFAVDLDGREGRCRLPKIGDLRFVCSRPLPSEPSSVTVIREADGRTYLSFVARSEDAPRPPTGRAVGVDLGLSSFAAVSSLDLRTGELEDGTIETPAYLRRRARALARSQRALARKKKGSKNRDKARRTVAVQHRKVREARLDHAHKVAASIVASHDVVCVEDLSVVGLARTRLARSIADQGLGQVLRLLEEKAERAGRCLVKVDRFFPSTQRCSACGEITGPKGQDQLGVRHWTCRTCGVTHDRDVNAARNLLAEGLRLLAEGGHCDHVAGGQPETQNACGAEVRPPAAPVAHGAIPPREEAGRLAGDRSCVA